MDLDTLPDTMERLFGFGSNTQLVLDGGWFAIASKIDECGHLNVAMNGSEDAQCSNSEETHQDVVCLSCECRNDFEACGHRVATHSDEAFLSIATVFSEREYCEESMRLRRRHLDIRPETVGALHNGFSPGDLIKTPQDIFGKVIGVNIDGYVFISVFGDPEENVVTCTGKRGKEREERVTVTVTDAEDSDDDDDGCHLVNDEEREFLKHAVRQDVSFTLLLDMRRETLQSRFGLVPGSRLVTCSGLLFTAVGVDAYGELYALCDGAKGAIGTDSKTKKELEGNSIRVLSKNEEKFFFEIAVEHIQSSRKLTEWLDIRPDVLRSGLRVPSR